MTEQPETPQETKDRLVKEMPRSLQLAIEKIREKTGVIRRFADRIDDDALLLADEAQKLIFAVDLAADEDEETE